MDNKLKQKIEKIKAMINGGTQGESEAAREALNRIIQKHDLDPKEVESREYCFKYSTRLELRLMIQINKCLFGDRFQLMRNTWGVREICCEMEYSDYVAMDCAYEYFRRHMKAEWKKNCAPLIRIARGIAAKNKKRKRLQNIFFNRYIIESKLYKTSQLVETKVSELSQHELEDWLATRGVEGGKYHDQMTTGLYLDQ